jgi:pimeloyl-ACP methyl ester carboxylesterase
LPGMGNTQAPAEAWGLNNYADFIKDWLDKINVKELDAIIGHSNGGAVAIKALSENSLKANKLILIASAGIRNQQNLRKKMLWMAAKSAKVPLSVLPSHKAESLKKRAYGKFGSDLMVMPHMKDTFVRTVKEDLQEAAKNIQLSTLLIYGQKDKDTPIKYGKLLTKAIPNSRLEELNTGHFVHQEQPARVAELIQDFLKN